MAIMKPYDRERGSFSGRTLGTLHQAGGGLLILGSLAHATHSIGAASVGVAVGAASVYAGTRAHQASQARHHK